MNIEEFTSGLAEKGISLSSRQLEQFELYYEMLVEWNEKINLTSITEKKEVYLKHFYDSITAAFYVDFKQVNTICDVGAGAGFPSLPIKICFPHLQVSIVDSLNKRITFLEKLAEALQLENTSFYHDRAETFGQRQDLRESYDIVTARAVARLSVLSELCLPLVKKNGLFVALKAASAEEELKAGKKAITTLGGELEQVHSFKLPLEESDRNIIVMRKEKNTPKKYPRKPGTPNKSPIEG
ncbi:16S rRNA (guanine(527)-N(7))-methyltransferase RsmG [Bacillus atrophaeus]|uniref:16S rRNA (guanine(527)-N(7))-methyltransferase RsmG n=1 Tax=Bacillus atrophaeus TaxID=1452 RepID=UPI00227F0ABC|nr:16S rRNA (guanine(527)-N(7))-methyltransferase RsmG [Bacillus atrophaeus]MCY8836586.1 16S rRNA (guanine(527)-N(7))-methyltransferase RsmG [Bacillus atrophaeus]MEC1900698.1 16S rRNA (guanine(527)-N(7))-methyltransferase RsmG [Bacillus atrophaeus]MEC2396533.1 16S rRNA (guanine(527)-N(7))-methyltransferase RsmG [Bacillus atrophaeus]MED4436188.1 16S rRNA (guanine(527)-N(7))-methyltransferase RsmG [Bacillus atrophaeus]MED4563794.1 16S rRNA (guanine(527)-N(7))-methyltransferase RsmG [Bacillus atr